MKIRKANKKNEWHMVRRFGVRGVRPVTDYFHEEGNLRFHVSYYYCVGFGPVAMVGTMIDAVDEMDAYKKVMDKLKNKEITTKKAKQRQDYKEYNRALRAKKNGADAWHKAMIEYLGGFKNAVGTRLLVG